MKKIIFIIITLILTTTSCHLALRTYYDIREPKIEDEKSLKDYLKRKKINTNNVYTVNYSDYNEIIKQIKGIPEILIFDKTGRLIKYKDDKQCNGSAFDFIKNLDKNQSFTYIDNISLNQYMNKLKDFNGQPVRIDKNNNADYYLFIFWARFTGRLNKNHVKVWEKDAKNNPKCHIKVFKVNMDQQKWWKKTS